MIKQEGSFRETLQKGWLTSAVLTETLSKFTGDLTAAELETMGYTKDQIAGIIELGQTANDAATKVKTITQLTQTLSEALQSGWAKTWQLIIGDFEEAKAFMTEISDILGAFIGQSSDARNNLLEGWKKVGGRANVIEALTPEIIKNKIPISEAIKEVFPPLTYRQLQSFTLAIQQFTKKLIIGEKATKTLKTTVKAIATVFQIAFKFVKALVGGLARLFGAIGPVSIGFSDVITKISDWLIALRDAIVLQDTFNKVIDKIAIFLGKARDAISGFALIVATKFGEIKVKLQDMFKNIDTSGFTKFIDAVKTKFQSLNRVGDIVTNIFDGIKKLIDWLSPYIKKIAEFVSNAFSNIGDMISTNVKNTDFNTVFDGLNAGLLAALVIAISKFLKSGTDSFKGIADILDSVKGSIEAWQTGIKADTLMKIAGAIAILAVSLIALSMVDSTKLTIAMGAITAMFAELLGSMAVFNKISGAGIGEVTKVSVLMVTLSIAIGILAGSISRLAKLDAGQLTQGLIGLSILMAEVLLFSKLLASNSTGVIKGSMGLIAFSLSLGILSKVVANLGALDIGELQQGLVTLGILLATLSVFMASLGDGKNIILTAISLTIISASMLVFANVLGTLGAIPINEIINGLVAMAGIFTILVVSMQAMPKNMILTSISLVIVAGALILLSKALTTLGGMTWDEIARGLVMLAGSLVILTVAMYAMTGALAGAAAMLIMAAAIAILAPALKTLGSMSMTEIGKSLLMLVGVFAVLAVAGILMAPLVPILLALGAAMFLLGVGAVSVGVGVLAFSAGLAALAVTGVAGAAVLALVVTQLLQLIPLIVTKLSEAFMLFLQGLIDSIPLTMTLVETFLLGVIGVIIKVIPKIVEAIYVLVTSLLEALASYLPRIVQAGYDIILAILNGIANNIGGIITAGFNIVINFLNAITKKLPEVIRAGWKLIISFIDGLTASVEENMPTLMTSTTKLGIAVVEGFAKGIKDSVHLALTAIGDLAKSVADELKKALKINSPSKVTIPMGSSIDEGLAVGIAGNTSFFTTAIKDLVPLITSGLSKAIGGVASMVNDTIDLNPTIRPVMDLSDIIAGNKQIGDLFDNSKLNVSTSANQASMIANGLSTNNGQNGSNIPQTTSGTTVSLTQINNSPVALSRFEIYRQTQNQLRTLKGLVNN